MKKIERKFKIIVVIVGFLAIIACIICYSSGFFLKRSKGHFTSDATTWKYAKYIKPDALYSIKKVIDGDTMIVDVDSHDTTIRLIGIDTPETVDPRKSVGCFGHEASDRAHAMLESNEVYLEKDPTKGDYDKYGRSLVYVHIPVNNASSSSVSSSTRTFYNQFMIENGFAREYTFSREPYKYQTEFKAAQEKAMREKIGLWNPATCNGK
jgi:micrococcal nuclease